MPCAASASDERVTVMSQVLPILLLAFGVCFIIEGLLPFFSPAAWKRLFEQLSALDEGQIRFLGLICLSVGLLLLWAGLRFLR